MDPTWVFAFALASVRACMRAFMRAEVTFSFSTNDLPPGVMYNQRRPIKILSNFPPHPPHSVIENEDKVKVTGRLMVTVRFQLEVQGNFRK